VPNVKQIRDLNLPGTPLATSACCGRPLPLLASFYTFLYPDDDPIWSRFVTLL